MATDNKYTSNWISLSKALEYVAGIVTDAEATAEAEPAPKRKDFEGTEKWVKAMSFWTEKRNTAIAWPHIRMVIRDGKLSARGMGDGVEKELLGKWLSALAFDEPESDSLFFNEEKRRKVAPAAPDILHSIEVERTQLEKFWPANKGSDSLTQFSPAKARKWYQDRVANWPDADFPPSRKQDEESAIEAGFTSTVARELRRELAPKTWREKGRRPGT